MRLALVTLLVPDYDAAIAWFTRSLGWRVLEDRPMAGKRWVRVGGEGAALLLAQPATSAQRDLIGRQGAGRVWLFLETDDFARDHARLTGAGVAFEEAPRTEAYGTVAVFRDPWGNRWDLIQPA